MTVFDSADPDFFPAHADMTLTPADLAGLIADLPEHVNVFQAVGERLRHQPQVTIVKLAGKARGGGAESVDRLARNIAALPDGVVAAAKHAIIPRDHADGLTRENDAGAGFVFRSATAQLMGAGLARYVTTLAFGIAVQAASGVDRDELQQMADAALRNWPLP
ncbi:hypothetical protein AB0B56_10120 [Streptosporangium canum]|uniref:hypothetical protein n=1 Tax=Streptosporangium canum TaxID=324952 RepID=UPI003425F9A0